jgi:hypothetical protein
MRATVNVEFTSEELAEFVEDQGRRLVVDFLGSLFHHLNHHLDPQTVEVLKAAVAQGVQMATSMGRSGGGHRVPGGPPPPAPGSGPVGLSPGYGYAGPAPTRESPVVENCFRIEATRQLEEGWGCCRCSTYNGLQREHCRHCGHPRCGPVVTPAPEHPEVPVP